MDIDSTAISAIDYDAERAKLLVRFASGERYVYVGVPGEVHRSFVEALDNRAILVTHNRLQDNISMARRVHQRTFKTQLMSTIEEHFKILDALEAHDIEAAVDNLEAHFRASTYRTFAAS